MMVTGTVVAGTSIARQVLQEDHDHDQHQDAGLDQRRVDLVDRGRHEAAWYRTECP
jgi:type II secretory pathway predicted ATPase ExeA